MLVCISLCSGRAYAEALAVVVNPIVELNTLTKREVVNIYMGRQQHLGNQNAVRTIDLADDSDHKSIFYKTLVNRDLSEINSYWARLLFSGKSKPPATVESVEDAKNVVANDPTAIAYIPLSQTDSRVKIVFTLPR